MSFVCVHTDIYIYILLYIYMLLVYIHLVQRVFSHDDMKTKKFHDLPCKL